ncbi:MAG TPA: hypothetical protein VL326_09360 [Kofleriaceae bacterium]|jgi:hypothetical protein|nr:hypothetical protein [Kofleriaceae bacterium]
MLKRVALVIVGAFALWIITLLILGAVLGGRYARSTEARVGESLQASATVASSELALIRGRLTLQNLAVRRDDAVGHLAIDVTDVRCELAPMGWALVDRDCGELEVRGVRVEVSTAALFKLKKPQGTKPIKADRVVIEDAQFVFLPSAFAPNLGQIEIDIDRAVAGPTTMRTPLSWLFALQELDARFALPANITLHLHYRYGMLTVAGSIFGSQPISLPVQIPAADAAHDAHEEMQLLLKVGKDVGERVVAQRATDWLRSKLK